MRQAGTARAGDPTLTKQAALLLGSCTARKDGEFFAAYHADTQDCILYRNLFSGD